MLLYKFWVNIMNYFNITINIILDMMTSMWFWAFILGLLALGRCLFEKVNIDYAGKIESHLNIEEKKRKKRLIFWGRVLFSIGIPFIILFVVFCIFSKRG